MIGRTNTTKGGADIKGIVEDYIAGEDIEQGEFVELENNLNFIAGEEKTNIVNISDAYVTQFRIGVNKFLITTIDENGIYTNLVNTDDWSIEKTIKLFERTTPTNMTVTRLDKNRIVYVKGYTNNGYTMQAVVLNVNTMTISTAEILDTSNFISASNFELYSLNEKYIVLTSQDQYNKYWYMFEVTDNNNFTYKNYVTGGYSSNLQCVEKVGEEVFVVGATSTNSPIMAVGITYNGANFVATITSTTIGGSSYIYQIKKIDDLRFVVLVNTSSQLKIISYCLDKSLKLTQIDFLESYGFAYNNFKEGYYRTSLVKISKNKIMVIFCLTNGNLAYITMNVFSLPIKKNTITEFWTYTNIIDSIIMFKNKIIVEQATKLLELTDTLIANKVYDETNGLALNNASSGQQVQVAIPESEVV